jgi:hypothetical protein
MLPESLDNIDAESFDNTDAEYIDNTDPEAFDSMESYLLLLSSYEAASLAIARFKKIKTCDRISNFIR